MKPYPQINLIPFTFIVCTSSACTGYVDYYRSDPKCHQHRHSCLGQKQAIDITANKQLWLLFLVLQSCGRLSKTYNCVIIVLYFIFQIQHEGRNDIYILINAFIQEM